MMRPMSQAAVMNAKIAGNCAFRSGTLFLQLPVLSVRNWPVPIPSSKHEKTMTAAYCVFDPKSFGSS